MTAEFSGVVVPMITPLTEDEGLDRPSVRKMVDFLVDAGVHGLFILGSIGEGAVLRPAVRHELAELVVEAAAGRVPVIAGAIEASTARVVDEIRALAGRGLSGYVATTPFYFGGYNDGELHGHFARIAEAADLPVLLYNIPQNTKVPLSADLAIRLSQVGNIAGVKDSSGDWAQVQSILLNRPSGFRVLQGNQSLSAISILAGADGLVPGHANVWPQLLIELMASARKGDMSAAFACQARLDRAVRLRGRAVVHTFKAIAKAQGLISGDYMASPAPRLSTAEVDSLLQGSAAAGLQIRVCDPHRRRGLYAGHDCCTALDRESCASAARAFGRIAAGE